MSEHFFEITDDLSISKRWYLQAPLRNSGKEIDPRIFTEGRKVNIKGQLRIPMRRQGLPLDVTFADFDMPVISKEIGVLLEELAPNNIQRIPISIESQQGKYEILNITTLRQCVNEQQSDILWWTESDGRPDKVGQYRMVRRLIIDPSLVEGSEIFRVKGWEISIIVSQRIKDSLASRKVTGIQFRTV